MNLVTNRGRITIIDEDKYYLVKGKTIYTIESKRSNVIYAYIGTGNNKELIHHLVFKSEGNEIPYKMEIDHKDWNRLNNQYDNLRLVTRSQNRMNMGPYKNNSGSYKGVTYVLKLDKWCAAIQCNGKRMHIGLFNSSKEAAIAYNDTARKLYGENAWLNPVSEIKE